MLPQSVFLEGVQPESDPSDSPSLRRKIPVARSEALLGFKELVAALGGKSDAMLRRLQIDPVIMDDPNGLIPYRSLVRLLEISATDLECPDLGMRLALTRGASKIVSPLDVVMRNSRTLGDALRYCADNVHVYSTATQLSLDTVDSSTLFLRFEITLDRLPYKLQAVEHALTLMYLGVSTICEGAVRPREIWFTHQPNVPTSVYRANFAISPRFGQPMNGLLFNRADVTALVPNPDRQMYELATSFIAWHFPKTETPLSIRVRTLISRTLSLESCGEDRVAAMLGMHPRTLQRKLKDAGVSFEVIKEGVRRDKALEYLQQTTIPLVQVAAALGYAEPSTLARSCHRWFAASPNRYETTLAVAAMSPS